MVDTRAYFTAAECFTNDQLYFSSLTLLSFSNIVFIAAVPFKNLTKNNLIELEQQYPYSPCTSLVPVGCSYSLNSTIGSGKISLGTHPCLRKQPPL
jgi:hypothetical protein